MRHIVALTAASSAGLVAIFAVDFINIFYLTRLENVAISAAAGFAATLFFFFISIGIGLTIAATALVAPALGAGDLQAARRLAGNIHVLTFGLTAALCIATWPFLDDLLSVLGATGEAKTLAVSYSRIALPSMPFLTAGMVSAAVLRSVGDARRSMYVTLIGAIVTAILDPIFIFGLGLGIEGAAIASSMSRLAIMIAGLYGTARVHNLLAIPSLRGIGADAPAIVKIAIPAILTNLATPFANAYVTGAISKFGDGAVAGWTIIGRLMPVAFVGMFALTGSIGPILGQNLGARLFPRVREGFTDALLFAALYTAGAWLFLALAYPEINAIMKAQGQAVEVVGFFCVWLAPFFAFMGALFVSNAAFNKLGRPQLPTYINWARATLGTVPFVMLGAEMDGAKGVLIGQTAGSVIFAAVAVALCYRYIAQLSTAAPDAPRQAKQVTARWWFWPSSNPRV
jgi:putative MATE family efflux protein